MKKRFTAVQTVMLVVLAAAVTFAITYYSSFRQLQGSIYEAVGSANDFKRLTEVQKLVDKYFVGEYDGDKAMDFALDGYVYGLGDKWSLYMPPETYDAYEESSSEVYSGIGVSANYDDEKGGILVMTVYDDSPAKKAGLLPFDVIVTVNGENVKELGYNASINKIRGEEGTDVTLGYIRGDAKTPQDITMARESITMTYVTSKMLDDTKGYIRISEFGELSDEQFILAADKLRGNGAKSLVIDVRNDPGGSLRALLSILDYIFEDEVLFIEENKAGSRQSYKATPGGIDMPIVVLINEYSISAAEYFAAVLDEYDRATLVGTPTTGKGYGQNTFKLESGGALILSTLRYYLPSGKSLKDTGIKPDVEIDVNDEVKAHFPALAPEKDPQLVEAMRILTEK